ncbi:hypothetical protein EU528_14885, partial [Candidatus Thorarchaeota archaeon]
VTSILVASAPMITAPLSAVYLNEDVNKYVAFGTLFTIVGIFLVVFV